MREGRRVAVVMGGVSAEREVSLASGDCITRALSRAGFEVVPVQIHDDGRWEIADVVREVVPPAPARDWFRGQGDSMLRVVAQLAEECDAVVNGLHGPMGEDGTIQGLFRIVGVPLSGPAVIPAAVTMDKCLTKNALSDSGIDTPAFFRLDELVDDVTGSPIERSPLRDHLGVRADGSIAAAEMQLPFPLPWIAKPRCLGSSVGVEIFRQPEEFSTWYESHRTTTHEDEALETREYFVEQMVDGRELTVAVIETEGVVRALPAIEIIPRSRKTLMSEG
ncbi:MAG: hypothetical protein AAF517_24375 [Planctomycetota bacterium]